MPDQNVEVSNSRSQTRSGRFGGLLGSYRIYKRGITANETAPADDQRLGTNVGDRYEECLWAFKKPPLVTSYSVTFLRWVSCVTDQGAEIIPGFWVQEAAVTGLTGHYTHRQLVSGDYLACYVSGIVGATGDGFIVLRKGLSRRA